MVKNRNNMTIYYYTVMEDLLMASNGVECKVNNYLKVLKLYLASDDRRLMS